MTSDVSPSKLDKELDFSFGIVNGPIFSTHHRRLGSLRYAEGDFLDAIYHFSESHAVSMRQIASHEQIRMKSGECSSENPYLFYSNAEYNGVEGLIKRLENMPEEWTIVQLTRECDPIEAISFRKAGKSPKLKNFFLSRLPCGKELMNAVPVVTKCMWPDYIGYDLIEEFLKIKEKLATKKGNIPYIKKIRLAASNDVENYCRDVGHLCFKEWVCLLLGKLYSKSFEEEIRDAVNNRLKGTDVSTREKYLCYLLAEGCCYLENSELEVALYQVFEKNETLAIRVLETLVRIKEDIGSRLLVAKRHPVLLILDDHLDVIPWESLPFFKRHPVSRIYSIRFADSLHKAHKDHIKDGLREINESEVCYYVINPDGNLPESQERISKFVKKRFPKWVGIIGEIPSEEQLMKALTTESNSQVYMYCGHGSGAQYIRAERIQRLNVKPLQLLYGCNSVGLKDYGTHVEMHGDVMEFAIAKSGCTIGMLWPVTSSDTDKITMGLANICLPGIPIDMETFEPSEKDSFKREPELLRAIREVREYVTLYSNGAALVARGIPIKLTHTGHLFGYHYHMRHSVIGRTEVDDSKK